MLRGRFRLWIYNSTALIGRIGLIGQRGEDWSAYHISTPNRLGAYSSGGVALDGVNAFDGGDAVHYCLELGE